MEGRFDGTSRDKSPTRKSGPLLARSRWVTAGPHSSALRAEKFGRAGPSSPSRERVVQSPSTSSPALLIVLSPIGRAQESLDGAYDLLVWHGWWGSISSAADDPPMEYTTRPLAADTWDAFVRLGEKHNGVWGGCWCTWFHPAGQEKGRSARRQPGLQGA